MSKHLLAITPVVYTGKELGDIKRSCPPEQRRLLRDLPEYTINEEFQKIVHADYYLQWIEEGDQEYILFDVSTSDSFLNEELSYQNIGDSGSIIEDSDEELLINILKNHAHINKPKDMLPSPEYLIINVNYFGGQYPDYDWEVEYGIDGFINKDLETIKL